MAPPSQGPRQARKVITVLFSDVTGFTAISERVDTEAMHAVMAHYREAMSRVIERHGGRIERFIGDAVMAVFGLPVTREDDALRALQAASDIGGALADVNAVLPEGLSLSLTASTGVNTGEVFVSEDTIARAGGGELIGDAVNVAARLEGAARPGEVLMGEATYRLTRHSVQTEQAELALKGKSGPVVAHRLRALSPPPDSNRTLSARTIGRERETRALSAAFGNAVAGKRCALVTIVGDAGSGKSRLVRETLGVFADRALTLSGRCLPYGEATTYWPLAEIACAVAGIRHDEEPEVAIEAINQLLAPEDESDRGAIAARLAGAFGIGPLEGTADQVSDDVACLIRCLAASRSVVLAIEDIHWAGARLFRTLEEVVARLQESSVLIVCTARPELREVRSDWPADAPGASELVLGALDEGDSASLVEELLDHSAAAVELVAPVCAIAAGNPLVLEEALAMLIDDGTLERGDDGWRLTRPVEDVRIPPTIGAVLAARIDQLPSGERELMEMAAVVGKDFERADVAALSENSATWLEESLRGLINRQLVDFAIGDATDYRFHHILVRDAAYGATPKRRRSELHERFADYLERTPGGRSEGPYGEIAGEHLERACLLRRELGEGEAELAPLSHRAGTLLAAAGKRAQGLSDFSAAGRIYRRGESVLARSDPLRAELLTGLAEAKTDLGLPAEAAAAASAALEVEPDVGEAVRGRAALLLARSEVWIGRRRAVDVLDEMRELAARLERCGDAHSALWGWSTVSAMSAFAGRFVDAYAEVGRAVEIARREVPTELPYHLVARCYAAARLPIPIAEARATCTAALAEVDEGSLPASMIGNSLGVIMALEGDLAGARDLCEAAIAVHRRHGDNTFVMHHLFELGMCELLYGDYTSAELRFRQAREAASDLDEMFAAEAAALHSRALAALGEHAAAVEEARSASSVIPPDDLEAQTWWRLGGAIGAAGLGELSEARRLAEQALELARSMQTPLLLGAALRCAGEVMAACGSAESEAMLEQALAVYRSAGAVPGIRAVEALVRKETAIGPASAIT